LVAAPGHVLAGVMLGRFVEQMSDVQGYEIRGNTDPGNVKYLDLLLRRGYEITAVHFRRRPRVAEPQRESESERAHAIK
jgi:hypothetical protein